MFSFRDFLRDVPAEKYFTTNKRNEKVPDYREILALCFEASGKPEAAKLVRSNDFPHPSTFQRTVAAIASERWE